MTHRSDRFRLSTAAHAADAAGFPYCGAHARAREGQYGIRAASAATSSGSNLNAFLADACVVVSCLIQHGAEPRDLAARMGRLGNVEPTSIIGAVVDLTADTCLTICGDAGEASA